MLRWDDVTDAPPQTGSSVSYPLFMFDVVLFFGTQQNGLAINDS